MPRKPTAKQLYDELMTRYGRSVADAFLEAVRALTKGADLQRMLTAIRAGDIEAALGAVHIDEAAYGPVLDVLDRAYGEGGQAAMDLLPRRRPNGAALVLRFDIRNPTAAAWLREYGAAFVRQVVEDQRVAIRSALVAGMGAGANPRTVALDIIGRVNRVTGEREGGIIGLTSTQEGYVRAAQAELSSGNPVQLRAYLQRTRRDRRFDRSVAKAIRERRPLPAELIEKATSRYKARLLDLRGETIGRTEALTALNASQHEALRQSVEGGALKRNQVRRVWRTAVDRRVRHTHAALHGDTAGLEEAFVSPSGALLRFPGDPTAPISERANCRCWCEPRVDWAANLE